MACRAIRSRIEMRDGILVVESRVSRWKLGSTLLAAGCRASLGVAAFAVVMAWFRRPAALFLALIPLVFLSVFLACFGNGIDMFDRRRVLYSLTFFPNHIRFLRTYPTRVEELFPYATTTIRPLTARKWDELWFVRYRIEIEHLGRADLFPCESEDDRDRMIDAIGKEFPSL